MSFAKETSNDIDLIHDKLPCGNTWWHIEYVNADKWEQQFYTYENNNNTKTADLSCVIEETTYSENKNINISKNESKKERIQLWNYVVKKIDPCYSLYNNDNMRYVIKLIQDNFRMFVMTPEVQKRFTAKKCRILVSWLAANQINVEDYKIIHEFLLFMLDNDDELNNMKIYQMKNGNWFLAKV